MASITFATDPELQSKMAKFFWVNWSVLVREELLEREKEAKRLIEKLHSQEEQELIRWSVELGRKAKKESFKKLLSRLSPKRREELLNSMPSEKREEYT